MIQMKKWKKALLQLIASVLILGASVYGYVRMTAARKAPERKEMVRAAPLVSAFEVSVQSMQMTVKGNGTVQARKEVQVVPQVAGKIVRRHEHLVNGGFFHAREPLVVVEKRDYQIAVEMAESTVTQAEVALEIERAEAQIAKDQWQKMNPGKEPKSILVYHEPQIRSAQAQLRSAGVQLEKTQLDLERTVVSIPFDGRILQTHAEVGQFVTVGQSIATVYATDAVEIEIPLRDSQLEWLDLPLDASGSGPGVTVRCFFAGALHAWQGSVVRTLGRVDVRSRMVSLVVQVDKPFDTTSGRPPLTPGMFVQVEIVGRHYASVISIPRHALRPDKQVWLAVEERLKSVPVTVLRLDKGHATISSGLSEGDVVITSSIDIVTDGMGIRVRLAGKEQE